MKIVSSLFYIFSSSMPAYKILLCLTKDILPHNFYFKKKQQLEKQKAHEQKDEWGYQIDECEQLDDKVKFLWSSHQSHLENVLRLLFLCIYIYIIPYFYFVSQKNTNLSYRLKTSLLLQKQVQITLRNHLCAFFRHIFFCHVVSARVQ